MAENLYGYGLDFENPYGRNTTGHTGDRYSTRFSKSVRTAYTAVYTVLQLVIRPYVQGLAKGLVQGLIVGLGQRKVGNSFKCYIFLPQNLHFTSKIIYDP
jgi:hypothetical protein